MPKAAIANEPQRSFGEEILTGADINNHINAWCDAQRELKRLSDLRQQIRELEKQKKDAKEKLAEHLDLSKPGLYRVGSCVVTVSLPEESQLTVTRTYKPKIRIKDELPE